MKMTITLEMDGSAFTVEDDNREPLKNTADAGEVARLLKKLAAQISDQYQLVTGDEFSLRDLNGHKCLTAKVKR